MDQNRKNTSSAPNRASRMEKAEGSRENVRGSSSETPGDLGTSSDRAMFSDRGSSEGRSSSERGIGSSSERGMGGSSSRKSSNSGGISNRELSREECEQEQLPGRGRSGSER